MENKEREEIVRKLLEQGLFPKEVEKRLKKWKISYQFILKTAKKYELPLEGSGGKNKVVLSNPFIEDDISNYWLGFLIADGGLQPPNSISLQIKDLDHLEIYKNFINSNLYTYFRINEANSLMGTVKFCNSDIYSYLISKGLTPAKSLTIKLNCEITSSILRGIFDGDGSVCSDGPKITTGSLNLLNQICDFLKVNNINYSISDKGIKNPCYDVIIRGDSRFLFFDLIYENAEIYLPRKYDKFRAVLKKFKIKNIGLIAGSLSLWKDNQQPSPGIA